jgi:hypothetical protein
MSLKKIVVAKEFVDKHGQKRKAGDRIEVDEDYGKELIRKGEATDPEASQPIAKPPEAEPKS